MKEHEMFITSRGLLLKIFKVMLHLLEKKELEKLHTFIEKLIKFLMSRPVCPSREKTGDPMPELQGKGWIGEMELWERELKLDKE